MAVEDVAVGLVELLHWFGSVGVDGSGEVVPERCGFGEGDGRDGDDWRWVGDGGRQASPDVSAGLTCEAEAVRRKCGGPSTPLRSGRDDASFAEVDDASFADVNDASLADVNGASFGEVDDASFELKSMTLLSLTSRRLHDVNGASIAEVNDVSFAGVVDGDGAQVAYLAKIFRKSWNFGVGWPASSRGAP